MHDTRYYFYIITRDYGFAPNPFYGYCTLACCKPSIRQQARKGDWVIGLGSNNLKCRGSLIFAMKVTEILSFNEYYKDARFRLKKPNVNGSFKAMHGDNVYHKKPKGKWIQDDCHHHHADRKVRCKNIQKDVQSNKVLISDHFFYFGKNYISKPTGLFHEIKDETKELRSGYKFKGLEKCGRKLVKMLRGKYKKNYIYGEPISWNCHFYKKQFKKS